MATENKKYGYLVISCYPGWDPLLRVASNIFQYPINIYIENKCAKNKMNESSAKCMYLVEYDLYKNILETTSHKSSTKNKPHNVNSRLFCAPTVKIISSIKQNGEYKSIHKNYETEEKPTEPVRPASVSETSRPHSSAGINEPTDSPNMGEQVPQPRSSIIKEPSPIQSNAT